MDSEVPLADVLLVLRAKQVAISAVDEARRKYVVAGNGWFEEITFTDPVSKNRLHYLARKFSIPVFFFWNTQMLGYAPGENPN